MILNKSTYNSPLEFITDMMINESVIFKDFYGRQWYSKHYKFYYKDLNMNTFVEKLCCLHLYSTTIVKDTDNVDPKVLLKSNFNNQFK